VTALAVALGGALGALGRYGLGTWVQNSSRGDFPLGTMTVNLLGCLLLGFAATWMDAISASLAMKRFAMVGVLGAFTTFSTYSFETLALLEQRLWSRAALYSLGSLGFGLVALMIGMFLGGILTQGRG